MNMERIAEIVPDTEYQVLQNVLDHSSWDYQGVMEPVSKDADTWLGGEVGTLTKQPILRKARNW
jgi:hypothetical protein